MVSLFGNGSLTPDDTIHATGISGLGDHGGTNGNVSLAAIALTGVGAFALGLSVIGSPILEPFRSPVPSAVSFDGSAIQSNLQQLQSYWAMRKFASLGCVVQAHLDAVTIPTTAFSSTGLTGLISLPYKDQFIAVSTMRPDLVLTTNVTNSTSRDIYRVDLASKTIATTSLTIPYYRSTSSRTLKILGTTGAILCPDKTKILYFPGVAPQGGSLALADQLPALTYNIISGNVTGLNWFNLISQGVLMPDGRVFLVPIWNNPLVYNPQNDAVATPPGDWGPDSSASTTGSFWGGCLLQDGRVFCCPHTLTTARIYDPITNTTSTPTPVFPGASAFRGCVTMLDGRVFLVPYQSTTAQIYDPVSDTVSTPPGTYPGNYAFSGALILPDGRVFCIPMNAAPRIYDPVTQTLTSIAFVKSGTLTSTTAGGAYYNANYGATVLPNGNVLCCGNSAFYIFNCGGWGYNRPPTGALISDWSGLTSTT